MHRVEKQKKFFDVFIFVLEKGYYMRISAISHNVNVKFNGLWADTQDKNFYDEKTDTFERKEWHVYRPFKDEDPEQVEKYLADYKPSDYDPDKKYLIQQGGAFTFTEAEFNAYQTKKDASELTRKEKFIHSFAQNSFYNSELYAQRSAVNPNIIYYPWQDPDMILRVKD